MMKNKGAAGASRQPPPLFSSFLSLFLNVSILFMLIFIPQSMTNGVWTEISFCMLHTFAPNPICADPISISQKLVFIIPFLCDSLPSPSPPCPDHPRVAVQAADAGPYFGDAFAQVPLEWPVPQMGGVHSAPPNYSISTGVPTEIPWEFRGFYSIICDLYSNLYGVMHLYLLKKGFLRNGRTGGIILFISLYFHQKFVPCRSSLLAPP